MKILTKNFVCCFVIAALSLHHTALANSDDDGVASIKATKAKAIEPITTSASSSSSSSSISGETSTANKDKRQIATRETQIYPNHRSTETIIDDDPENGQETIYGPKPPNQFIIRAVSPHQHQQHEEHQEAPQLRNYPTTATTVTAAAPTATAAAALQRHQQQQHSSSQLLDQSQEVQHYAYLQDLSRNHPKTTAATFQGKSRGAGSLKKTSSARAQLHYSKPDEAEQRYAVTIQAPTPTQRQYLAAQQYHQQQEQQHAQQQHQQQQIAQHQHQQDAQQYQIIPEEHFLKLIEQELQARAFHDEHVRQQQHAFAATKSAAAEAAGVSDRSGAGKGLGEFRQRYVLPTTATLAGSVEPTASLAPTPSYVHYVPRHRGGPKYLPQQQQHQHQPQHKQRAEEAAQYLEAAPEPQPELPPQIAYYQPQISYKTLPNHPLAKSSLEKEIEKLLANNQHHHSAAAVQIIDNSNEPSAIVNHHHYEQQPETRSPKSFIASTTPNSLLDANNQPFVPSLFRFSSFQQPTPIYPTQVPQHLIEAKKLGPVVYPNQNAPTASAPTPSTAQPAQPSQYYYQEAAPIISNPKPKLYRPKQYELKVSPQQSSLQKSTRNGDKPVKLSSSTPSKYAQQLVYDIGSGGSTRGQSASLQFYPSQPDPSAAEELRNRQQHQHRQQHEQAHPTQATKQYRGHVESPSPPPNDFRQYVLPAPVPSQSSIFVSQGTGVTTPSRPHHHPHQPAHKPTKTLEDVKQLRLPQPGGKPLTQAEFQALIDAGYPLTAVPVPVPVPYEQYIKDHPEYRNQPLDYTQIMRNAQQQYAAARAASSRTAAASEPSVKIVSSPSEPKSAAALGGGSVTYLRPYHSSASSSSSSSSSSASSQQSRRHPRNNDKETETVTAAKDDKAAEAKQS